MAGNNLTDDFDFSRDQDKLDLLADLAALRSANTTLRKRLDESEKARENNPVFPASMLLVPDQGGAAGGALFPAWSAVGSDAVSGFGYTTHTIELDEGLVQDEYSILGEESLGAWYGAPIGSIHYMGIELAFQIPKGIEEWRANAIEFDWRSSVGNLETKGMFWSIKVAGAVVASGTNTSTASGAEDTGWTRSVLATGSEMGSGFSITPGTRFLVTLGVYGNGGQFYIGNLHFNWK